MTPGDFYLGSLDRDDPSAGRTKLDVILETIEDCTPHWIDQSPACRVGCASFVAAGPLVAYGKSPTCSIAERSTGAGFACYPMIAAMVEALQVPHE